MRYRKGDQEVQKILVPTEVEILAARAIEAGAVESEWLGAVDSILVRLSAMLGEPVPFVAWDGGVESLPNLVWGALVNRYRLLHDGKHAPLAFEWDGGSWGF